MFDVQKAGTAYIERHPMKYPKRRSSKPGGRSQSHLSRDDRKVFDSYAKQEYWDLRGDIDGNDRPNLLGILEITDLPASDAFFDKVYKLMKEKLENRLDVAAGAAAGGSAGAAARTSNVLFMDTDEEN